MKIYTKVGDTGKTSLLTERVSKSNLRIETNGQIDELLVMLAVLIKSMKSQQEDEIYGDLQQIYKKLFVISSMIADINNEFQYHIDSENIEFLENKIDEMSNMLPKLKSFIYYTGSDESMLSHQVRAKVRSIERITVNLYENEEIDSMILIYLNRLSDYFFTLARYLNVKNRNEEDILKL